MKSLQDGSRMRALLSYGGRAGSGAGATPVRREGERGDLVPGLLVDEGVPAGSDADELPATRITAVMLPLLPLASAVTPASLRLYASESQSHQ